MISRYFPKWVKRTVIYIFLVLLIGCTANDLPLSLIDYSGDGIQKKVPESTSAAPLWYEQTLKLPKSANGKNYLFERITSEEGLSQNIVHTIIQDSFGYIWIGTSDGLNRYDGYRFVIFRNDPDEPKSISNNNIWAIFEDKYNNLWLGTEEGLNLYDRKNDQFIRFYNDPDRPDSLSNNKVRSITEDDQGDLWIGTWGGGLNHYDRHQGIFIHYTYDIEKPNSLSDNFIKTIYGDSKGLVWVATSNGLNRFDPRTGRFTVFQRNRGSPRITSEFELDMVYQGDYGYYWSGKPTPLDVELSEVDPGLLSNNQIQAIIEDDKRRLWIGTAAGLDCLNLTSGRFDHYRYDSEDSSSLSSNMILSLFFDQNEVLWVGTNNGLNGFNEEVGKFTRYTYNSDDPADNHSIGNQIVNTIYQDLSGAYWIGTSGGGVNRFDPSTNQFVHNYHDPENPATINGNMVWSFEEDTNIGYWVGTSTGIDRYDVLRGLFKHYSFRLTDGQDQSAIQVYSIMKSNDTTVWAGTSRGLFRYDPISQEFVPFHSDSSDDSMNPGEMIILDVVEKPIGQLWLGTYGAGLIHLDVDSGQRKSYEFDQDDPNSLSSNLVGSLLVGSEDDLYIGTRGGGLNKYLPESDSFLRYTSDPNDPASLSENNINALFESSTGEIWIATMGGLNRFNRGEGTFDLFSDSDGLASNVVYGILEDNSGILWISTNNGITRYDPQESTYLSYTCKHGLQANEFNPGSTLLSNNGLLFFGGVNGFTVFDPSLLVKNTYIAPVRVTSLTQSGKEINLPNSLEFVDELTLDWPKNYFEFKVTVMNYIQREENRVAYKLSTLDDDWRLLEPYQTAAYENLPGGTYTLFLKGANNDGFWSEPIQVFPIRISAPFWETNAFRIGGVLLAAAVIMIVVQMRVRGVQRYNRILRAEVEERTKDIEKRRMVAEGLREILFRINSDQAIEDSLDFVVCQTNKLMHSQVALIFTIEETEEFKIVAYSSTTDFLLYDQINPESLQPDLKEWVARVRKSKKVFRVTVGRRLEKYLAETQTHFRVAPIYSLKTVLGALAVLETQGKAVNEEDIDLLRSLADQAGLALENSRLRANAEEMAVVTERNRIARDLHDAITQTLFSANLIAESLPNTWHKDISQGKQNILALQKLNRSALAEMRTLLLELRPDVITEISFSDLIEQMAATVRGRVDADVELDIRESVQLPANIHLNVYRIAQESITNIIKHAKAQHVNVKYSSKHYRRNGQSFIKVETEITDDGIGFEPENIYGVHFGVKDMYERAEGIGASLKISSQPGEGTHMKFAWKGKDS